MVNETSDRHALQVWASKYNLDTDEYVSSRVFQLLEKENQLLKVSPKKRQSECEDVTIPKHTRMEDVKTLSCLAYSDYHSERSENEDDLASVHLGCINDGNFLNNSHSNDRICNKTSDTSVELNMLSQNVNIEECQTRFVSICLGNDERSTDEEIRGGDDERLALDHEFNIVKEECYSQQHLSLTGNSMIEIVNVEDTLCVSKAIIIAWCKLNKILVTKWKALLKEDNLDTDTSELVLQLGKCPEWYCRKLTTKRNDNNLQQKMAIKLCTLSGTPIDRHVNLNDIPRMEKVLNCQILVLSVHHINKIITSKFPNFIVVIPLP
jgi:hypothetical protein